jgi:hyperosmotically inducible periplasmic protein
MKEFLRQSNHNGRRNAVNVISILLVSAANSQREKRAMHHWKTTLCLFLSVIVLLGLCSCRTAAGRTPGQVLDDMNITTTIKSKIFNDPYLSGFSVSVDTFQGEVTLTGAVESEFAKNRATELAETIYGVHKVNNLLLVR